MIKAVFFDLYNTLIDFDPPREEIEAKILKDFGIDLKPEDFLMPIASADEFIYAENARLPFSKRSKEEMIALYARYQGIVLKEAGIEPTKELIGGVLRKWQEFKFEFKLFDDVLPSINQLKEKGIILGLISNVDHDITPVAKKLGFFDLLQIIVTSQEAGVNKPNPEIFKAALEKAGIEAQDAIYVGDQYQIDVVGANGAGMKGILLDRDDNFTEIKDCPKIKSLTEVADYL